MRPSLVSVSRALPTARTLRSRSSFATLPHQREIHAFAAFKKGSTAADLSSPSGNHLQPRTVRPTFVPSKLYHVAAQSPRKSSVGLFGLAIGIGLATWAAVSDDSRTLEAKGLAASGRELCMLTRMNDFDGLNRLFPSSGIEPGKDASGKPLPDPDSKHPMGWAAIHVAAANNNVKMVRFWLDHGADVDIADDYEGASGGSRFSSGGVASFESIFDMIKARQQEFSTYLDPRADFGGFTALHYACLNGNRKIIELLLERGADPTRKDHEGRTPREYLDDTSIHDITEMNKLMDDYEKRYLEEKRKRDREMRRKYPLDAQLKEKIVGQAGPIESVASAIRRRENGWHDADKPLVFLFLGSSGIGKTELAKQLAAYLHKGNLLVNQSDFNRALYSKPRLVSGKKLSSGWI